MIVDNQTSWFSLTSIAFFVHTVELIETETV